MILEIFYQGKLLQEISLPYHFKMEEVSVGIRAKSKMKSDSYPPPLPAVKRTIMKDENGGRTRNVPNLYRENNPNWRGGKKKTPVF